MDEEKKRSVNRERVKRHRAVKADVEEILRKRSRHQLCQSQVHSSPQNRDATDLESSDVDKNNFQGPISFVENSVSGESNIEEALALPETKAVIDDELRCDDQIQSSLSTEINLGFKDENEQMEIDEQSSVFGENQEQEAGRHGIELDGDEGQDDARIVQNENADEVDEITQIRNWAIVNGIQQNKLDQLLAILRRRLLPNLPKSSKTFLNTAAANYNIKEMESADGRMGEYVYLGIAEGILACVQENLHEDKTIRLQFNVDGVPLFNSSTKQFWPILCKVYFSRDIYEPFVVAIYSGDGKPKNVNDYLADFVREINQLLLEGIAIDETHYNVEIHCFICDTPARSFLKCVKGHGGYWACERCETRGERVENRTVYPEVHCQERTDRSFRCETQREHHNGRSALLEIQPPFDIIFMFVLDFMHLCCIGIMKKLAEYWIFGKSQNRTQRRNKLGSQQRKELSSRMDQLKYCMPAEFQRKPRGVNRIALWKATEFRFFLLYCGPIVLRGILNPLLYKHFLLLHTACRILCSNDLAFKYNAHANRFLKTFFTSMPIFYGRCSQILNAHNLIHISKDVINMGCTLSKISAFPLESLLGKIKMYLRNANRPLAQVCRRLHESGSIKRKPSNPQIIQILNFTKSREDERIGIRRIKYKGFILTTKRPNNLVILDNNVIVTVTKMTCPQEDPQRVEIEGNEWKIKSSIYKYPTASRDLKMWRLASEPTTRVIRCSVRKVHRKMVQLEIKGNIRREEKKIYGIPFLHE